MDGIFDELLRLEDAKHHALISLDSEVYADSVQQQVRLIDDPGFSTANPAGPEKLLDFSKLAQRNKILYENLLATAPWIVASSRSYTDQGHVLEPPVARGFSVEG